MRSVARIRQTSNKEIEIPSRTATFAARGQRKWLLCRDHRLHNLSEHDPVREHYAIVDISSALLEDSVFDLDAEMNIEFAEQFAKAEGTAFISGNGTNKPTGTLTVNC